MLPAAHEPVVQATVEVAQERRVHLGLKEMALQREQDGEGVQVAKACEDDDARDEEGLVQLPLKHCFDALWASGLARPHKDAGASVALSLVYGHVAGAALRLALPLLGQARLQHDRVAVFIAGAAGAVQAEAAYAGAVQAEAAYAAWVEDAKAVCHGRNHQGLSQSSFFETWREKRNSAARRAR